MEEMEAHLLKQLLKLYLVTDRHISRLPLVDAVARAVAGGVTAVQLREKDLSRDEICELTAALQKAISGSAVLFTINRDLDAALSCAQGVHLGRGAPSLAEARDRGAEIIGASTHSRQEALDAQEQGASYVFFGPVFQTASKPAVQPQGLEALSGVRSALTIPLVAIGGITHKNVKAVLDAGADGVAVVSSILASNDPEAAARGLRKAMEGNPS
jgi:thiamine-phosphate pyrophosphorylase